MKQLFFFLISGCLMLSAVCQPVDQSVRQDSLQKERLKRMAAHRQQQLIYEKMYAEHPKETVDSTNWAQINQKSGVKRLSGYQNNLRLDTLKEIDLTAAGLEEVPGFVLKASQLEVLILDKNHIKKLPKELGELPKLKRIYWRGNQLDDFWWIRIQPIDGLEKLDISNNSLSRLPIGIRKLDGLKELVVEENFFEEIPVRRLKKADFIQIISFNKSHRLQINKADYEALSFLKVLKVNQCSLQEIDPSFYQMTGLNELQLQGNQLDHIPEGISNMTELTKLSLYKNQLKTLPVDLFELDLKVIDLYYNQLEVMPAELGNMTDLEILYLAHNKIYEIPESIGDLTKLAELYLHHNRLSVLPQTVSILDKLKVVRLNDNYLQAFPTEVLKLNDLEDLDISNNQIKTVPEELSSLDQLKLFTYQDNPIDFNAEDNAHLSNMIFNMLEEGVICVPRVYKEEVREPAQ